MNKDFRADLHTHTNCSDGTYAPSDLLELAKKIGMQGIAITDHDTIDAYTPELFTLVDTLGVKLLPGVEISSILHHKTVHILAYGKNVLSEEFSNFLEKIQSNRKERNEEIIRSLQKLGFDIDMKSLQAFVDKQEIYKGKIIGRPHIAGLLLDKGYVKTVKEAFDLYLADTGKCFSEKMKFHPKQVIDMIHKVKAFAVLAHPHLIYNKIVVKELLSLPFDGIECFYGRLLPYVEKKWLDIAGKNKWIATGGSDFHGDTKPHISLGCSWTNFEDFSKLYD